MKKFFLLLLGLMIFTVSHSFAQDNQTSLGLRIGPYYGITLKHFLKEDRALEGILATRKGGFSVTGLYEVHTNAFSAKRLKAFGGIGGHINIFDDYRDDYWRWDDDDDDGVKFGDESYVTAGLDMIIGLEYTFKDLPFSIGVDWKPAINFIGDHGFSANQLALSIRFIF